MLVKETSTLHKVLAKYLSNDTLKAIMSDVFKAYSAKLEEEFKKLDLFSSAGKNRLLIDVQYYIEKLSALDGTDGPSNHMEVVVNNIKIKDKRAAMSSAQASTLAPRSSSELGSGSSGDVRRASIVGTPEKPIISPLPPKGSEAGKKFTNMFNYATPTKK